MFTSKKDREKLERLEKENAMLKTALAHVSRASIINFQDEETAAQEVVKPEFWKLMATNMKNIAEMALQLASTEGKS